MCSDVVLSIVEYKEMIKIENNVLYRFLNHRDESWEHGWY